jgi:flagellar biosynthesis chaperone FliJ
LGDGLRPNFVQTPIKKPGEGAHIMSNIPLSRGYRTPFENVFDIAKTYLSDQSMLELSLVSKRISTFIFMHFDSFQLRDPSIKDKICSILIELCGKTNFRTALKMTHQIHDVKIRDTTLSRIVHLAEQQNYTCSVISIIDRIQDKDLKKDTLLEISRIRTQKNPKAAFELFYKKKIENEAFQCSLRSKVVVAQAYFDPKEAIRQAEGIPLLDIQKKTLWKIAGILAKTDLAGAIKIAEMHSSVDFTSQVFFTIAVAKAAFLEVALGMVSRIKSKDIHEKAIKKISVVQAQINIHQAIAVSKKIECEFARSSLLVKIVSIKAEKDPKGALKILDQLDGCSQGYIRYRVAKVQARTNVREALKTAKTIQEERFKMEAFIEAAANQSLHSLHKATKIVDLIKDPFFQEKARSKIVSKLSEKDFEKALCLAGFIKDQIFHDEAYSKLALKRAEINLEEALELCGRIHDGKDRNKTLGKIAVKYAHINLEEGVELASKNFESHYKSKALSKIVEIQMSTNPWKALNIASLIGDSYYRGRSLKKIIFYIAKLDRQRAFAMVNNDNMQLHSINFTSILMLKPSMRKH